MSLIVCQDRFFLPLRYPNETNGERRNETFEGELIMAGKKQSGCQHLSPRTGKWEPCVGPENCDYRKQGLDVPHAYSQAEREAIDAQRAGVDNAGLGGNETFEASPVQIHNEALTRELESEILQLREANEKKIENLIDHIELNIDHSPDKLEATTNTSDRTLLVYGINGEKDYFSFNLDSDGKIVDEKKSNLNEDGDHFMNNMSQEDVKEVLTYKYNGKSVYVEDSVKDIMKRDSRINELAYHNGILGNMRMPDLDSESDPTFSKMSKTAKEQYFNATVDDMQTRVRQKQVESRGRIRSMIKKGLEEKHGKVSVKISQDKRGVFKALVSTPDGKTAKWTINKNGSAGADYSWRSRQDYIDGLHESLQDKKAISELYYSHDPKLKDATDREKLRKLYTSF